MIFDLKQFDFFIPDELIAQQPLEKRSDAKLLIASSFDDDVSHHTFGDLVDILPSEAVLVLNRSKVIPARIWGKTIDGKEVEVFLLEPDGELTSTNVWHCIGKPMKQLVSGRKIIFEGGMEGQILQDKNFIKLDVSKKGLQSIQIKFESESEGFWEWLVQNGSMPLPPYIQRPKKDRNDSDFERYQSVFSDRLGSVAASTASLHFSSELMEALKRKGITFTYVTLHVGAGTFFPIKSKDIREHEMHWERFYVEKDNAQIWLDAFQNGKPIICVGTTSLRAMESMLGNFTDINSKNQIDEMFAKCRGEQRTNLFIYPTSANKLYRPKLASGLITNFHQPMSSLFVLVCALLGHSKARTIYEKAIKSRYRFFSYGDACFFKLKPELARSCDEIHFGATDA